MMKDIENKADVAKFIEAFYEKVRVDPTIGAFFQHVDWDHHTPIIVNFWEMILLGGNDYKGNPFQKHLKFALRGAHFEQWLKLFRATVDEHFEGPLANEAKQRAESIALLFQHKLGLL